MQAPWLCLRFTRFPVARLSLASLTHALFSAVFRRGIRARPRFQLDSFAARGRACRMGPGGPTTVHGLQAPGGCENWKVFLHSNSMSQGCLLDLWLLLPLCTFSRKFFRERVIIRMIYSFLAWIMPLFLDLKKSL